MLVVRDDEYASVEVAQGVDECLHGVKVEVVGGLVKEQQVRPLPHDLRKGDSRLLAAREGTHLLKRLGVTKAHAAEVRADLQRLGVRVLTLEGLQSR